LNILAGITHNSRKFTFNCYI